MIFGSPRLPSLFHNTQFRARHVRRGDLSKLKELYATAFEIAPEWLIRVYVDSTRPLRANSGHSPAWRTAARAGSLC